MILVLDSGVWISALHFGGVPRRVLDYAIERATIALCESIAEEIRSILRRKFRWQVDEIEHSLADFRRDTRIVAVSGHLRGVCRDPNDDMVLECAVVAGAEFIVTGDKDLLTLGSFRNIRILTPREFLSEFVNNGAN